MATEREMNVITKFALIKAADTIITVNWGKKLPTAMKKFRAVTKAIETKSDVGKALADYISFLNKNCLKK